MVQEMCGQLVNEEAARVVYKNNYSFGVKIFNIYMVCIQPFDFILQYLVLILIRLSAAPTGVISVIWAGTHHTIMVQRSLKKGPSGARNTVNRN